VKKNVLSCWRNVSSNGEALIIGGRSFHALAAATGKATRVSQYQKAKTNLDFTETRHSE